MSARADFIVVGAGVSGLFTALSLFEAGLQPVVIPAPQRHHLLPQLDTSLLPPWQRSRVLNQLEARALQLLPELTTRLALETGVDLSLETQPLVALESAMDDAPAWGAAHPGELLAGSLVDFEPQMAEGQRAAVCLPARHSLRSDRLARALSLALIRRGVEIRTRSAVKRLDVAGNIVLGVVLVDDAQLRADATVLAADQSSGPLLHASGLEIIAGAAILAPALQFAPSSTALRGAVVDAAMRLVPHQDGRLIAISNLESDQRAMLAAGQLRQRVHACLPGLGRHDLELYGRLAVPSPELRATVGAYPGVRGLWLNIGHDPFGPIIAPAAAEFLSEQLAGGPAVRELAASFS